MTLKIQLMKIGAKYFTPISGDANPISLINYGMKQKTHNWLTSSPNKYAQPSLEKKNIYFSQNFHSSE